jgi:hypothetical protein
MMSLETEREEDGRWIAEVPALSGVMAYAKPARRRSLKFNPWHCACRPIASIMVRPFLKLPVIFW